MIALLNNFNAQKENLSKKNYDYQIIEEYVK